jgi:hypothetical protein
LSHNFLTGTLPTLKCLFTGCVVDGECPGLFMYAHVHEHHTGIVSSCDRGVLAQNL